MDTDELGCSRQTAPAGAAAGRREVAARQQAWGVRRCSASAPSFGSGCGGGSSRLELVVATSARHGSRRSCAHAPSGKITASCSTVHAASGAREVPARTAHPMQISSSAEPRPGAVRRCGGAAGTAGCAQRRAHAVAGPEARQLRARAPSRPAGGGARWHQVCADGAP